jgi:hypothetical protein
MLNGLSKLQQEQYNKIAQSRYKTQTGVEWFDQMPQYKQQLIKSVAGEISKGGKLIPTQLLGDVAGIRNAYQKVTAISSDNNTPNILSQTIHLGAPATKIKNIDTEHQQEIVRENLQQLKNFFPKSEKINLNILNSMTIGNIRGENFIFEQLKRAEQENKDIKISASPINRWRFFGGGRDNKVFEENLNIIGQSIQKREDLKNVSHHLVKGGTVIGNVLEKASFGLYKTKETKAKLELKNLGSTNPNLARDLKVAVSTRSLMDTPTLISGFKNINLDITANMSLIRNSVKLENGALNKAFGGQINYPDDANFCKSGKDRTGYVEANETRQAVSSYLNIRSGSNLEQQNFISQIAGGHTQEMAGIQGGTIGCHSIKTNPEFGFNKSDKAISGLLDQKSSHFNSSIKVEKEQNTVDKLVKSFENSFKKLIDNANKKPIPDLHKNNEITNTKNIQSQLKAQAKKIQKKLISSTAKSHQDMVKTQRKASQKTGRLR